MATLKRRFNDISPNDSPQDEPPPKTAKTTRTRNPRIQECTICASDLPLKSFPRKLGHRAPNTRHSTCSACWQQHLATQLTADKPTSQITCPQCPYVLREVDVKALGSPETHAVYLDKMFQETMQADPNWRTCPEASCSFGYLLTQDDDQSDSIFNCRVCQAQYCVRCEVPMHRGQTCEAYQAENNGRDVNEDEEASRAFLEEYAKVCPKCGVRIRKNGGCDHMTCRKCKHEFCWLCFASYRGPNGIHTVGNGAHEGTCRYHPDILHRTAMGPPPPPPLMMVDGTEDDQPSPAQTNPPRRRRDRGVTDRPIRRRALGMPAQQEQQQVRDERQAVDDTPPRSHAAALLAARRAQQPQQPARNNGPTRLFAAHDSGDETDWGALARKISPAPQHTEPPEAARGLGITNLDGDDAITRALLRDSVPPEPQAQTPRATSPALSADYDPTPPTIRASMSPEPMINWRQSTTPPAFDQNEVEAGFDASIRGSMSPQTRPRSPSITWVTSDELRARFNMTPEPQQPRSPTLSPMPSSPELSPLG